MDNNYPYYNHIFQKCKGVFVKKKGYWDENVCQKKINGEWATMGALATGEQVLVDNCIRLELQETGASYMLIRLPDFNLMEESENIDISNEKKVPVAAPRDWAQMSGGAIKGLMMLDKSIQELMPDWCSEPF